MRSVQRNYKRRTTNEFVRFFLAKPPKKRIKKHPVFLPKWLAQVAQLTQWRRSDTWNIQFTQP